MDSHHDDRLNRPTGYFTSRWILKWWTRAVTLRLLLGANQPCSLLHYEPLEIGGRDGCCPHCLLPDKEASLLFFFTTMEMDAGVGVAPTKTGL